LATSHTVSFDIPPAIVSASPNTASSKILALIEGEEGKYQISLSDTYQEMGEKTFKGLRRALPLTRQKLDWDKVRTSSCFWDGHFLLLTLGAGDGLQAGS
jgi:capping protein alpha